MATPTYDLLDSTTLASSASSVTFSSLDTVAAGYRDLILVIDKLGTSTIGTEIRFNSDSGSNYPYVFAQEGPSTGNGTETSVRPGGNANATVRKQVVSQIMDFSATDKHKPVLTRSNVGGSTVIMHAARWANTAAITSITITPIINQFAATSTFHLYGIAS